MAACTAHSLPSRVGPLTEGVSCVVPVCQSVHKTLVNVEKFFEALDFDIDKQVYYLETSW